MLDSQIFKSITKLTENKSKKINVLVFATDEIHPQIGLILGLHNSSDYNLYVLCSRWDIYAKLINMGINVVFSDFVPCTYFNQKYLTEIFFDAVLFAINKEKLVMHQILRMIFENILISQEKPLHAYCFGEKNSGIKTWLKKIGPLSTVSKIKKVKNDYILNFTLYANRDVSRVFNNEDYAKERLSTEFCFSFRGQQHTLHIYSKPGVFGWKKNDVGSEFLVEEFLKHYHKRSLPISMLDLGCGSGILITTAAAVGIKQCYGTDNNAAAISACNSTLSANKLAGEVYAADAGLNESLSDNFQVDLVLCNPPFHRGFSSNSSLTEKFVNNTKRLLKKQGNAFFVVNSFVALEKHLEGQEFTIKSIEKRHNFKVIHATATET